MLPHWSEPPICSSQPFELEQLHVVVGLQQHVAELGVGEAGAEAAAHRLLRQHLAHRHVLADVAQEVDGRHRHGPGAVVEQAGLGGARLEVDEAPQLGDDVLEVAGQDLVVEQVPLLGSPARIADHAGRPARQGDRTVAVLLEATQDQQADEVAGVEAVGGRIAAVVEDDRSFDEPSGQRVAAVVSCTRPRASRSSRIAP